MPLRRCMRYLAESTVLMTGGEQLQACGACCGAADLLAEVRRREKALGVEPDWDVDAMMKAGAIQGAPSRCCI